MKISPVSNYPKPKYPSKEVFIYNPELLKSFIPKTWKRSKLIVNALLAFILSGNGSISRVHADESAVVSDPIGGTIVQPDIPKIPYPPKQKPKSIIAPIFIHGEGRGATGCVVMSPPVFISEDEARQVIETEFAKENLRFDKSNILIDNVNFGREKRVYTTITENGRTRYLYQRTDTIPIPLILDRINSRVNIGYEYISSQEQEDKFGIYSYSTATSYDLLKLANDLKDSLENKSNFRIAIFYDPLIDRGDYSFINIEDYEKNYEKDKIRAKEVLRMQVTDFIEWAKKEAILPFNTPDTNGK